jgi:mediator of replication checkpoint protein 1
MLNKLRKPGHSALDLTQDVVIQPAFQIGSGLLCKADQIFEKEQGHLLEAASKKLQTEPTLYVDDRGCATLSDQIL